MNANCFPTARRFARGVTLSELLGVLAILTILAAIFFPVYQGINPTVVESSTMKAVSLC